MSRSIQSNLLGVPLLLSASLCFVSPAAATDVDAAGYYQLRCASCHGANGEGTRDKSPSLGPPLRGNPLVINAPAEMLVNIIRHGRGGQQRVYDDAYPNMPAFDAGMVPDAMGLAVYLKTVLQQTATARRAIAVEPADCADPLRSAPHEPDTYLVDLVDRHREPIDGIGGQLRQSLLPPKGVSQ